MWIIPLLALGVVGFALGSFYRKRDPEQPEKPVDAVPAAVPEAVAGAMMPAQATGAGSIVGITAAGEQSQGFDPRDQRTASILQFRAASNVPQLDHETAGLTGQGSIPANQSPTTPDDSTRQVTDPRQLSPTETAPMTPSLAYPVATASGATLFR